MCCYGQTFLVWDAFSTRIVSQSMHASREMVKAFRVPIGSSSSFLYWTFLGTWNHLKSIEHVIIVEHRDMQLTSCELFISKKQNVHTHAQSSSLRTLKHPQRKSLYKPNPGRECWKMSQGAAFRCACQGRASPAFFYVFKFVASNRSG